LEIREWLDQHPNPSGRDLAQAGLVAPHLPAPWGRDADVETQLIIDEELTRAAVRRPINPIGIGWAGPTILYAGTDEQQHRWLP
jgi:alkylation response protein AidB-like acyl-CoA dehydrogenase